MNTLGCLARTIGTEPVLRAPEDSCYRGATAPGYPQHACSGAMALTTTRLVFASGTGELVEVSLAEITAMRQPTEFNSDTAAGRTYLVIRTRCGEIGFLVADTTAWIRAVAKACQ
jgi:hypothetical protein